MEPNQKYLCDTSKWKGINEMETEKKNNLKRSFVGVCRWGYLWVGKGAVVLKIF